MREQQIFERVDRIKPLLAGFPPDIQGAILAELTSIWLSGHPPQVRTELLDLQCRVIRRLVLVNDRIIFGDDGYPTCCDEFDS